MKTRHFLLTIQWGNALDLQLHTTKFETQSPLSFELIDLAAEKVGAPKGKFAVLCLIELEA